ncbi:hypothetical protein ONS95_007802 [Cadophora gregata]|uniref:uncharacterized protein n=1 Tax=Cadophora gregata TaxID=51156 RepID=UPI0026DBB063|nr:uncharacterized protein ONS95_007802 [Cadophora gregata]KAK0118933.1 hypothetical protein ONS96_012008 [Cadophora gregata f. sp. sojae]KAK0126185.1 hypothetical protein ONS95_007802 [Cadophora gregata]
MVLQGERIFKEVDVGNFHVQKGRQRVLELGDNPPPRMAHWRNNLTALSHDFNLYFAAYGDKIHITRPYDLCQTLSIIPDLVLHLPSSAQGINVGGYIDQHRPHNVNNMKIGKLGDFEILLIACDDGDVIGYYTRVLEREVEEGGRPPGSECDSPTSYTQPFFHDNVGISAWGLAIHQVSRLIAVGSNHREVTVFQPALSVGYDRQTGSRYFQDRTGNSWPGRSFPSGASRFTPVGKLDLGSEALGDFEHKDCRLTLPLGPSGSNIPSIDFVSDENGEAGVVLATDVNGKLWSLNLSRRETLEWPEIHQEPGFAQVFDEFETRGWGVLCIPTSYFMLVKSPQEALGVTNLDSVIKLKTESSTHCLQSLDISSSVPSLRNSSMVHPSCSFFHPSYQPLLSELVLETCPTPPVQSGSSWSVVHSCILDLLQNYRITKHMVYQPTSVPECHGDDWVERLMDILRSENWYSDAVGEWMLETHSRVTHHWKEGGAFFDAIKALQFLLQLPIDIRYRINSWEGLHKAMADGEVFGNEGLELTRLSLAQVMSLKKKKQAIPHLQEGNMAVIRTSAHDIEVIPPNTNMISTLCRNFLQQTLPHEILQDTLDRFDRLNMFAVIPELSLLVVASQKGRVALFTLTRLEDDFSDVGPVLMIRLDRILPPTEHEVDFRPNVPLLGMAVGPLQGKDKDGGMQRKIWRLILHYMDHTVLSYELKRGGDADGLVVL